MAKPQKPPLTTATDAVPHEQWLRLYELAAQVRAMEPWLWMEETDLFGIQPPGGGDVIFVSVMGLLGEYHAIAVYPGVNPLAAFWQTQAMQSSDDRADTLLETRQSHVCFDNKGALMAFEKALIQTLGLKFAGRHAWPQFKSFRPGFVPWVAEPQDAAWLALAMEQVLDVAPRFRDNPELLQADGKDRYLVRVPAVGDSGIVWTDEIRSCPPAPESLRITIPQPLMDTFGALEPSGLTVELDVFPSGVTVQEKRGERPTSPFMLLAVEPKSESILGVELLSIDGPIQDLWSQVPASLLRLLVKRSVRPAKLALRRPWLAMVLRPLCDALGTEVVPNAPLRHLTQTRRFLERRFLGR